MGRLISHEDKIELKKTPPLLKIKFTQPYRYNILEYILAKHEFLNKNSLYVYTIT